MLAFKMVKRIATFIFLLIIIVPLFISYQVWNTGRIAVPMKSDAIVILGAAQFNGRPTPVLQERIDEAFRIYEKKIAVRIITVGAGAPGDRTTEAASSFASLVKKGVPKNRLVALPLGRDTLTSTKAFISYMKLKKWKSVVIVTDPLHCYRAIAMARDLGIQASCSPTHKPENLWSGSELRYLIRETGAFLAYKTTNRVGIHLSDHLKNS